MTIKNIQTVLRNIVDATSAETAWQHLLEAIQERGFPLAMYAFTRFRTANGMGDEGDHLVMSNYPTAFIKGFVLDQERYKVAPMAKWALENNGVRSWRLISENYHTFDDVQKEVVAFNLQHGMMAGLTLGFRPSRSHEKAGMGFALAPFDGDQDKADALWEAHGDDLSMISEVAHLRIMSLPLPRRVLTARQTEVLEWVGSGKSIADAAAIIGLTQRTVEKHLRLAREALGVQTTAQAIHKASVYNQIFTERPN
ncbi:helix-turn-helix transcriptional regulator [Celeribacter marinus]|uniref:helix-turn-helix transcriptional regulator n=2 Tax=Celeribacter marinus TaxID=1397108 RepID=UPI0031828662